MIQTNKPAASVLLIDDNPNIEGVVTAAFPAGLVSFATARDGMNGLEMAHEQKFDIILLDLGLPDVNGFEILRQLKDDPATSTIPVVVLTAWDGISDKVHGFELGATDYITKPFEVAELRARIMAILKTKELQDRYEQAVKDLESAKATAEVGGRNKTEFLANMSHEIRTPMNGVIAMTGVLLQSPLSAEQRDIVETIRNSGETLLTIINEILDYSKIEAGKLELESNPMKLQDCIEDSIGLFSVKAMEKQLEVACHVDDNVPKQILGDVVRLKQVLTNLISNAIKFTASGEVIVQVKAQPVSRDAVAPDKSWLVYFAVRDTGIGIPKDRMDRLFKSFSQVDASTSRHYGGTGLGLAISKRLVELMGGSMGVESVLGKGTTFYFTIPAIAVHTVETSEPAHDNAVSLTGKRVLVVDDNVTNRRILSLQARKWGMACRDADGGPMALEWLKRGENFDVAILDMQMPDMDGLTLAREIRKLRPAHTMPLILLTSVGLRSEAQEPEMCIFASCLTKPVKQAQLHDVVLRVLEGPKPVKSERKIIAPQRLDSSLATRLPLKILVADDNVINQKVAVRLFQQMGYKVDCVSNGLQAVEAVDQHHYNVVFMDVQMPELDGLEATRRIRQGEKLMGISARESCVIIAMTANAMKGDREKCIDSGMHDYIAKPVRPEAIQETLERWGTFVRDAEKARMESNAAANSSRPSMADGRSPALARPATTPPAMDAHGNTMPQTPPMAVEQSAQPPVAAEVPAAKLDDNMPPVDMGRLMQFADGDIDALKEIIQLYLNQTMGHLDELEAAVNDKSIPDIMRMAHKSAGSSSTCGINAIVPPLRQMERNAHEGHISSAPQLMLQARQELGRIRQYFASQNLC